MKYNEEPEIWRWLRSKQAYNTGQGSVKAAVKTKGGSWSSYWATRRPGSLVLTVLSDTSIKLDWEANGVEDYDGYSVERSTDGVTYAEIDTVTVGTETFTDTGLDADTFYWYRVRAYKDTEYSPYCPYKFAVTSPVWDTDGETVADFDHLSGITKDGSNLVSAWTDRLGSGHDLAQATGSKQPLWEADGVVGDGSGDTMATTDFGYEQPHFIYAWLKQVTWTKYDRLISGLIDNALIQQEQETPEMKANFGTASGDAPLTIKRWGLLKVYADGASSKIYTFEEGAKSSNLGTNDMGGIVLFSGHAGALNANVKFARAMFRKSADNATMEGLISAYFDKRYGKVGLSDIYAMVGQELVLYDDSICEVKISEEPATGTFTCAVGTDGATGYDYTPAGAGNNAITMQIVTTSNDWYKTATIKAYAAAGSGTKGILCIGDSLMDNKWQYPYQMRLTLSHLTLAFLGTQSMGGSDYCEGHSGWTYQGFCTSALSPFVNAGQLDIPNYFTENSIATPDFVYMRCGVNEAFGICENAYGFTWDQLQTIGGYIDMLCNAFLDYDANLKVVIGIPTLCENTGAGWDDDYAVLYPTKLQDNYIRAICQLRNYIEAKYGGKAYNARVYVGQDGYSLDRDTGYPKTEGVHNSGIHCTTDGYYQLAKSMSYTINAILAGA